MIQEVLFRDNAEINSTDKVLFCLVWFFCWLVVVVFVVLVWAFSLGLFFVRFFFG